MTKTSELGETILQVAGELFARHGYASTSIKQIAAAAGCTTAALYYYYPEGKAHILREVVRAYSTDALDAVSEPGEFDDLASYLDHLAQRIGQNMPKMNQRLNWLIPELPKLPAKEREQFVHHFLGLQRAVHAQLDALLPDPEQANLLSWIIVCSFLGYSQLFLTLGFYSPSAPNLDTFGQALNSIISTAAFGQAE